MENDSLKLTIFNNEDSINFPSQSSSATNLKFPVIAEGGLRKDGYYKESYSTNLSSTSEDQENSKQVLPLVSIITVVFNGEKFLEEAIKSVLSQDYTNIEYLIIDGGSTDGTIDIIKKYNIAIDYWVSKPDQGIYDAMNQGIRLARGKLIGILNSDDWYESNTVSKVVEASLKNPEVSIFHGRMNVYNADGTYLTTQTHRNYPFYRLISTPFKHPTCFIKQITYQKLGGFDLQYKYVADYELMLRFISNGVKDHFIDSPLANLRKVGVTTSNDSSVNEKEKIDVVKKYAHIYLVFVLAILLRKLSKLKQKFF